MCEIKKAVQRTGSVLLFAIVLIVCICLAIYAKPAQAQEAELALISQNVIEDDGDLSPRIILEPYYYLTDRLGLWGYAYGEEEYASATVGPYYDFPFVNGEGLFEIGVAAGVETYPDDESGSYKYFSRFAGFASVDYKKFSFFSYYENGTSHDGWLRVFLDYHVTEHLALGVIHQTDDGTGPRITYTTATRIPLRIWVAPMFGEDDRVLMFSLEILFQKK